MKAFRYIIFIPVVLLLVSLVFGGLIGFVWLMSWTMTLNLQDLLWIKIVVGIFFGLSILSQLRGGILMTISIYFILFAFLKWLLGLGFWEVLIFLMIFGWGWTILKWLTTVFSSLTATISPNKEFGYWTVLIIGVLQAIFSIFKVWSNGLSFDIGNKSQTIMLLILLTIGIFTLTFRIIMGALATRNELY